MVLGRVPPLLHLVEEGRCLQYPSVWAVMQQQQKLWHLCVRSLLLPAQLWRLCKASVSSVGRRNYSGCLQNALFKMILPRKKTSAVSTRWSSLWGVVSWSFIGTEGLEKREGERRPQKWPHRLWNSLGVCLVNLQSVELWQVLESRLSNKLDGIVIKMAAMGKRKGSESAAHKEKMLLQVKSVKSYSYKPCRRCCCDVRNSCSPTVLFLLDIGTIEVSWCSEWALWGPAEPDGLERCKALSSPTEKHLALEDTSCDLTHSTSTFLPCHSQRRQLSSFRTQGDMEPSPTRSTSLY